MRYKCLAWPSVFWINGWQSRSRYIMSTEYSMATMKFRPVFSLHVFQSYIHHMINMLFSVLLKMFKKKMAHLFVNINFGFKFRYWLTHAIFDRFKLNIFFWHRWKNRILSSNIQRKDSLWVMARFYPRLLCILITQSL